MTFSPKISIALCTYNGDQFLQYQLDSFLPAFEQYENIELVIIDDCSTDDTNRIILDFISSNRSIEVHYFRNEMNMGVIENFEKLLNTINGDYIFLSDQDDIWVPKKFSTLIEKLVNSGKQVAFSDGVVIDENNRVIKESLWKEFGLSRRTIAKLKKDDFLLSKFLLKKDIITGCTMLIDKNFLSKCMPLSRNFIHDSWIGNLAALSGNLLMVDEKLIKYRVHESQQIGLGGRKQNKNSLSFENTILKSQDMLKRIDDSPMFIYKNLLEKKYIFYKSRQSINFLNIVKNILNKNYFIFSQGIFSIGKDMLTLLKGVK
ncbi:glycosyltransferase [Enterococcus gallinarum]|uniref:glycosyltransferase n=1 Tax=Enterococcus gallinarum TaxID=1353 RepID=UPI000BBC9EB4|nr:glycosyltransferase [Enterococcus gallinarum]MCD5183986.1 glycosyltransferase [Enterococcus gallinarum]PCD96478.1 hypothetical protein CKY18_01300 [Enterococcus gallinarum]